LKNTDDRINRGLSINPAFLLSVLLWELLQEREQAFLKQKHRPLIAFRMAIDVVLSEQLLVTSIPKRITLMMKEIWRFQFPLAYLRHKQAHVLVRQKRFRAASDFMLLRVELGEPFQKVADWWTHYQTLSDDERLAYVSTLPEECNLKKADAEGSNDA